MPCFLLSIMLVPFITYAQEKSRIFDDLNSKIGVIYSDSKNNLKFEIPNEELKKGIKILIVTLPNMTLSNQHVVCCAEVVGTAPSETKAIPEVHFDKGKSLIYDLKLFNDHNNVQLGFGIIDSTLEFREKSGKVIGDINKDGTLESFRDCTSMEGVHLTIWSGEPLKGTRLWHAYFYLGYDAEPSCLEEDFKQ